jgi:predicted PurR-regulated permease PerM
MSIKKMHIVRVIIILFVILIGLFLYLNREKTIRIITPFIMAGMVSYLVSPMVFMFERKKIKRNVSIVLSYFFLFVIIFSFGIFFIPRFINSATEFGQTIPELTSAYQEIFNDILTSVRTGRWSPDIKQFLLNEIQDVSARAGQVLENVLSGLVDGAMVTLSVFFDFFIGLVVAYYILKDGEHLKSVCVTIVPDKWKNNLILLGREINRVFKNFIRGQLIASLFVGTMETVGLYIAGVKYPLLLGVLGGITNIIPYFGPVIGAVPAVAVAFIQSPLKAFLTLAIFLTVQQVENSLITPRIMKKRLGIHPVTTIFAILAGGQFFGLMGMLFAVPAAAIIKAVIRISFVK